MKVIKWFIGAAGLAALTACTTMDVSRGSITPEPVATASGDATPDVSNTTSLTEYQLAPNPFFPDGGAQSGIFQTTEGDYMLCFRTRPYFLCKRFAPAELESCNPLQKPAFECGNPELFTVGTPL